VEGAEAPAPTAPATWVQGGVREHQDELLAQQRKSAGVPNKAPSSGRGFNRRLLDRKANKLYPKRQLNLSGSYSPPLAAGWFFQLEVDSMHIFLFVQDFSIPKSKIPLRRDIQQISGFLLDRILIRPWENWGDIVTES